MDLRATRHAGEVAELQLQHSAAVQVRCMASIFGAWCGTINRYVMVRRYVSQNGTSNDKIALLGALLLSCHGTHLFLLSSLVAMAQMT